MREMSHENVNGFVGLCTDPAHICILTKYCSKGSLRDILENDAIKLDIMFKASLLFDLVAVSLFSSFWNSLCIFIVMFSSRLIVLILQRIVSETIGIGVHPQVQIEVPRKVEEHQLLHRWTVGPKTLGLWSECFERCSIQYQ